MNRDNPGLHSRKKAAKRAKNIYITYKMPRDQVVEAAAIGRSRRGHAAIYIPIRAIKKVSRGTSLPEG